MYVIMRTDLDSLNPGKAMAQSNHAYGALKSKIRANLARAKDYISWQRQTDQDFGTVITLGGDAEDIQLALNFIERVQLPVVAGWVHDDTYPIRDGHVTHLIPLNTCAFVFGTKAECADAVAYFELHE
jgi:hypothetical protein